MFDWKYLPKIDAHIHLTPKDVIEANNNYDGAFITNGDVDDYVKLMEKYNIESAYIMPFNDPYMLSTDFKMETVNSNLKKMTENTNGKLYAFIDVDLRKDINDVLSQISKLKEYDTFLGIKIHPSNAAYPVDGMYYDEIFEFASSNDILVEIHSYPQGKY